MGMGFTKPVVTTGILGVALLFYSIKIFSPKKKSRVKAGPGNSVLFFTDEGPECMYKDHKISSCTRQNCVPRNLRCISNIMLTAKQSIDICVFRFSSVLLASYVQTAIKNGIRVRLISHRSEYESEALLTLRRSGASVRLKEYHAKPGAIGDVFPDLLMHHKFVVIDNKLLITGSLNWTKEATLINWEDAAIISQPQIVGVFSEEFERFWKELSLSEGSGPMRRPFPFISSEWKTKEFHDVFIFGEHTCRCRRHIVAGSPPEEDKSHKPYCAAFALRSLCDVLAMPERCVIACVHHLTLTSIANCLLLLHRQGITVRVITDAHMAMVTGSQIRYLIEQGIPVRGKHHQAKMHHKFIVLDNRIVLFGSINLSLQGFCGNAENLVITTENTIVKKFKNHFERLWETFEPVDANYIGRKSLR